LGSNVRKTKRRWLNLKGMKTKKKEEEKLVNLKRREGVHDKKGKKGEKESLTSSTPSLKNKQEKPHQSNI